VIDLREPDVFYDAMDSWVEQVTAWWRSLGTDERRFTAALKALVLAADVAGSAIPRAGDDPVNWSEKVLGRVCTETVLNTVVSASLEDKAPRPFQLAVETSPTRMTFVRAGCGSGKTTAAYMWAARNAPGRKLFFCYPTTGTASQGFADYVPPPIADARLVHSRAVVDLEDVLTNGQADQQDQLDWLTRFRTLAGWDAPITVCTVDTVLGLIQNNRTGLFSFPLIANAAFVFDEIHQYDEPLFGSLLHFLRAMRGLPILMMTASLPRSRLALLQDLAASLGERLTIVDGPAGLEAIARYQLKRADLEAAWKEACAAIGRGESVLWVANTVDRAAALAQRARQAGLPAIPYHSRYRYGDRVGRHNAVVRAFRSRRRRGMIAITTQVCEVSLNISADLLVTELGPVAAIIQRLGRLNRFVTEEVPGRPCPALIVEPPDSLPYREEDLADARAWLDEIGEGPASQALLAAAFDSREVPDLKPEVAVRSSWLDGGLCAAGTPLREAGTTIPVIREEDAAQLSRRSTAQRSREVIRLTIPMPLRAVQHEIGSWRREGAALVAPSGRMTYSKTFGGSWA
jgi:CRISPR-associated endonuclease/helicase Cas3